MPYPDMASCLNCGQEEVTGRYCRSCGRPTESSTEAADPAQSLIVTATEAPEAQRQLAPVRSPVVVRAQPVPPGYVAPMAGVPAPSIGATSDNRFTADAGRILESTGERIAWQGKPGLVFLAPAAAGWALILVIALSWAISAKSGWIWVLFWLVCALVHQGKAWLAWKNTLYRVTSQRLEITAGLLSQDTEAANLIHIRKVRIERRFPWNLLGYGNLALDVLDMSGRRHIQLKGLRDLPQVRDLIHAAQIPSGEVSVWEQYRVDCAD